MTSTTAQPTLRAQAAEELHRARRLTALLTDADPEDLHRQHHPLMSPLVWDLAHIGAQEELWLLRAGNPASPGLLAPEVEQLYDAFRHPRAERPSLPLLGPAAARRYLARVREEVLVRLDGQPEDAEALFSYLMVAQHEAQHDETMLATHQLRAGAGLLGAGRPLPAATGPLAAERVLVEAGGFTLGVDALDEPWSLDNERPAHRAETAAFWIARHPVTNAAWQQFIDAGGYDEPRWWSSAGWAHRTEAGLRRPLFWNPDGSRLRFGLLETVPPGEPVQHVCYYEAEAFAAWAGGRLPTEQEWEKAAAWDPLAGRRRRWPWGEAAPTEQLATLDGAALRPAPVGAYPAGASAVGAEQMIGDVWEWTSSRLHPWPGFREMQYAAYSAPFFGGDYRVLRGGSWATSSAAVRPSFRNWDLPIRRQIFCGLRLAWDA